MPLNECVNVHAHISAILYLYVCACAEEEEEERDCSLYLFSFPLAHLVSCTATLLKARSGIIMIAFLIGAWGISVPLAYVLAFPANLGLLGLW